MIDFQSKYMCHLKHRPYCLRMRSNNELPIIEKSYTNDEALATMHIAESDSNAYHALTVNYAII
jgi:hypothetical protein